VPPEEGPWCGPARLSHHYRARFAAPVELVRDHLLSMSLFEPGALAIPLLDAGFQGVHLQGERVTAEGRVTVEGRERVLTAWVAFEEPLTVTLRGIVRDPPSEWKRWEPLEGKRWAREYYRLEGRTDPGAGGTEVSLQFDLEPVRPRSEAARKRLAAELKLRFEATTVAALDALRGRVEREITAPHPKRPVHA
jgi:hypothetical protein